MVNKHSPTLIEIEEMQKFYDAGNSLRDIQKKFGWSNGGWARATLIKHLKTRHPKIYSQEERRQNSINKVIKWKKRTKQKLIEYKGGKCEVCGYNRCARSLVFHHKNPLKKDFSISSQCKSFDRLKKEVDKCILLCANCHGEIHSNLEFSDTDKQRQLLFSESKS